MTTLVPPQGDNPALGWPRCRLGVNIDHVATLRNARGGPHPDPVRAAELAIAAGADGITAHLREDRRHITDEDMCRLRAAIDRPLNFEMAATPEMIAFAVDLSPHAVCLVPERRAERTTEGGLDVASNVAEFTDIVSTLTEAGIRVSLFIDPTDAQIAAAVAVGAPVVELHTGAYHAAGLATMPAAISAAWNAIDSAARAAHAAGLEVHAGHGLTFHNVQNIASIPMIRELNIGHFLIGEAVFMGLDVAVREMRRLIDDARSGRLV